MKNSDKFQEFLSEFTYLAQESSLAESEWKEELYYKLTTNMQRLTIRESNDPEVDFKGFTLACTQTANRLEQITFNEQRTRGRTAPRAGTTNSTINNAARNPATNPTGAPTRNRMTLEEREKLMQEGKCFRCKQTGHLSKDCPLKQGTKTPGQELKAMEQHRQEPEESPESGKESP